MSSDTPHADHEHRAHPGSFIPDDPRVSVTIPVSDGWPTPISMRKAAAALDTICIPHYGDILRAVADAEDARFDAHGPIRRAKAAHLHAGGKA